MGVTHLSASTLQFLLDKVYTKYKPRVRNENKDMKSASNGVSRTINTNADRNVIKLFVCVSQLNYFNTSPFAQN